MHTIKSPEDFVHLFPGATCRILSCVNANSFTVIDTRDISTDDGPLPNPVTLVTVDNNGRPHTITVSAYALMTI